MFAEPAAIFAFSFLQNFATERQKQTKIYTNISIVAHMKK